MTHHEAAMVQAAQRVGLWVGVPTVVVAGVLRGPAAALTAAGAVAFVVAVFAVTGRSLSWAAERGPVMIQAVALGGFFLRLVVYAALIVALRPVEAIDGTVLAISTAVAMVAVLAAETRLVLTQREFWFVDASARPLVAPRAQLDADRKEHA